MARKVIGTFIVVPLCLFFLVAVIRDGRLSWSYLQRITESKLQYVFYKLYDQCNCQSRI